MTDNAIVTDPATGRSYQVAIEVITPELARQYLGTSEGNRPTRRVQVARYQRDMGEGAWRVNGQAVIFRDDGVLATGHHRLLACEAEGTAFTTFTLRGIDRLSARTLDAGQTWSIADHLAVDGYENARALQAVTRVHLAYVRTGRFVGGGQTRFSLEEVYAALEGPDGEALVSAARHIEIWRKGLPFTAAGGVFGALYLQFRRADPDLAEEFYAKLKTGAMIAYGDPEYALRTRFILAGKDRERMPPWDLGWYLVTGWNNKRSGTVMKIARVTPVKGGEWPEIA